MSHEIAIDSLSPAELDAFLGLTGQVQPQPERPRTLAARRELLRRRAGGPATVHSLDVNRASAALLAACGLSEQGARAILEARPYLSMRELLALGALGEADRAILKRLFHVTALVLPDGQELQPDDAVHLVPVAPPLAAAAARGAMVGPGGAWPDEAGPVRVGPGEVGSGAVGLRGADIRYRTASDAEAQSLARAGALRLPSFVGPAGERRFLDPRFVTLQLRRPIDDPEVRALLARCGLLPFRDFDTPGLLIAQIEDDTADLGALNGVLAQLAASDLVALVEPAWIAVDDIEARGSRVDLAAPGGDPAVPLDCAAPGGGAVGCWGTSFAAPHVAAALALIWSRAPELAPAEVRARLESACVPLAEAGLGRGRLSLSGLSAADTDPGIAPGIADPDPLPDPGPVPVPDPRPDPPPDPPGSTPGATPGPDCSAAFPCPGASLAALDCALPRITRRILDGRPRVESWQEVAAILGMTEAGLACLRAHA